MKVLIVPDKFKGTLTASEAAQAMATGWRKIRASDEIELLPMSDGGDGFGEVISPLLDAAICTTETIDAAHRSRQASWWFSRETQTAIVESAQVIGLALLPPGRFHPFDLDTFGLGQLLHDAAAAGARKVLCGIGGSATNDGGFGLASALGWNFLSQTGECIDRWTSLESLGAIEPPVRPLGFEQVTVAVDVQNPLLGPRGASRVYGPQKGLRVDDFAQAEACLARLAAICEQQLGIRAEEWPGAGAAGGLGFGLAAFLGAKLEAGFDIFNQLSRFDERISTVDVVLTGEGAIDESTGMGKGVGEVARLCARQGVRCLGLAGRIFVESGKSPQNFARVWGIVPELADAADAQGEPAFWLERLAAKAASEFEPF